MCAKFESNWTSSEEESENVQNVNAHGKTKILTFNHKSSLKVHVMWSFNIWHHTEVTRSQAPRKKVLMISTCTWSSLRFLKKKNYTLTKLLVCFQKYMYALICYIHTANFIRNYHVPNFSRKHIVKRILFHNFR